MLIHVYKTAQSVLELRQVINTGSFLHVALSSGTSHCNQFAHPHALAMLAQFILRAYVESSKHKNAKNWPLVASAMYNEEERMCIIIGVPPVSEEAPKRFVFENFTAKLIQKIHYYGVVFDIFMRFQQR